MALINCSECGHQISDKATNCVKCGAPNSAKKEVINCFECGVEIEKVVKSCKNCGAEQPTINAKQSETRNLEKPKNKSGIAKTLSKVFLFFALIFVVLFIYYKSNKGSGSGYGGNDFQENTYEEKVMTVEEIEKADPTKFLNADGTYGENFWGTKLKVHGIIKNTATVATYKDAVVRITYYSKTKTDLGNKEYTIYDFFPPSSEKKFELKIENYKDVNSIGWDVVSASVK
jgi:hypothetical protein